MKPVILGAGLAGLTTALALAPMPAVLISPCKLGQGCSSAWAQGGIAAALGANDNAQRHAQDTLSVGNGLNDVAIVRQITGDASLIIENLVAQGVAFDRDTQGHFNLGLEAAHQARRIVHALDATGPALMKALIAAARASATLEIIEDARAQKLIVDDGAIKGVVLKRGDNFETIETDQVVLATGGAAALWRETTNPHENWGGGLALAARAGATLGELEFMQFHPTAIDIARDPMPLASEALRGEGALLIDEKGDCFTDPLKPRDIVARAIWSHMAKGHKVYLDATKVLGSKFESRFPTIHALCLTSGIDPSLSPIPVRPAAHYHMGGVLTDACGRTDLKGLWACGEVACTGLHGANRLASNSLLEAASFGRRVADDIKSLPASKPSKSTIFMEHASPQMIADVKLQIRATMSDSVGVIRDRAGLGRAIDYLSPLAKHDDCALVGLMIAHCALQRQESRGAHYRSDYPQTLVAAQRSQLRLNELESL